MSLADDSRPAVGGIVLAGGASRRMGQDKASLAWDDRTLLAHVAGIVSASVDGPVVVAAAPGRPLPALPEGVVRVDDTRPDRGPLEGIRTGLVALTGRVELAFVTAVDVPFLTPALVGALVAAARGADAVAPVVGGASQPLTAVYRVSLLEVAERLLASGERRARALLEQAPRTVLLDEAALIAATGDVGLRALRDLDTPGDLEHARADG